MSKPIVCQQCKGTGSVSIVLVRKDGKDWDGCGTAHITHCRKTGCRNGFIDREEYYRSWDLVPSRPLRWNGADKERTNHMKEKLQALVGQEVNVVAGDDCADSNGIYLNFIGKLEAPEDGYQRFYLRCKDGFWGCEGIGFSPDQVLEIDKRASGLARVELREHLRATND